jgi:hypothetical protein
MWQGQINENFFLKKPLISLKIIFWKKNHKKNDNIEKKFCEILQMLHKDK